MSTNRPVFLRWALDSLYHLNTAGFEVVGRVIIDDYPDEYGRVALHRLVAVHKFDLLLHEKNHGLSITWKDLWAHAIHANADYIWHMEDDVEIQARVDAADLADLVDLGASNVTLARQKWYAHEEDPKPEPTDWIFRNRMRVCRRPGTEKIFSPMASFYPVDRALFDYAWWGARRYPDDPGMQVEWPNEGLVGKVQWEEFGRTAWHIKQMDGSPFVHHIGDWTVGKKQIPGEPAYERFKNYDPTKRYCSKTGRDWDDLTSSENGVS